MAEKVKLVLARPDKTIKSGMYAGIVLPGCPNNLTVIAGRAPSIVRLEPGIVQLLNEAGKAEEKFFVGSGVAQIVDNVCVISAEKALARKDVTQEEAADRLENAASEEDAAFYRMIADDLAAFPDK